QRSGTTWLGSLLRELPGVAYWEEPRHVWVRGNASTGDDRLTSEEARPAVRRAVRRRFERYVRERGSDRLAEKTPSNCLRVPFVRAIFPDAKFLLVVRDGRSVLRSTGEIMDGGVPPKRVLKRALETPLMD